MNEMNAVQACDPYVLIEALMRSGKALEQQLDDALAPVGLSAVKWNALRQLIEAEDHLSLGQLAERLACVKSNATQLVDRLESESLVKRVPDPEDRRSIRAELTVEGRERYAAGRALVRNFERQLLADFRQEEHLLLVKLLARLTSPEPVVSGNR